jgi:O-antigen/teichoic acid export membrane protein
MANADHLNVLLNKGVEAGTLGRSQELSDKPLGSGIFSLIVGLAFVAFFIFFPDVKKIDPDIAFKMWVGFAAILMTGWGIARIWKTSDRRFFRVGQPTINMMVGIAAATFAILAIVAGH